jgi:hypothetical protein
MGFHLENQWCALGTKFVEILFFDKTSKFWPIVKVEIWQKLFFDFFLVQNIRNSGQNSMKK